MNILRPLLLTVVLGYQHTSSIASPDTDEFSPGYITTPAGDSIRGFVLIRDNHFNSRKCVFKKSLTGDEKTYAPAELASYGADDKKYYSSFRLGEDEGFAQVFLEFIVRGKNSLLFYKNRYFLKTPSTTDELIIQTKTFFKDGKSFNVKQALYKSTLQSAMSDCTTSGTLIQETTLSEVSLKNLFKLYHECIGQTFFVSPTINESLRVRFGFSASLMTLDVAFSSKLDVATQYLHGDKAPATLGFVPAVWAEGFMNKFRTRIRTGVVYYNTSHQYSENFVSSNQTKQISILTNRLEVPVQIRFALSKNPDAGFYVIAGAGMSVFLKWEQTLTIQQIAPSLLLTEVKDKDGAVSLVNAVGGLGYQFPFGSHAAFLECTYSYTPFVSKQSAPDIRYSGLGITAGIFF